MCQGLEVPGSKVSQGVNGRVTYTKLIRESLADEAMAGLSPE